MGKCFLFALLLTARCVQSYYGGGLFITLKEIYELYGISRRAIQGYEKAGLLQSTSKNEYGYLLYDESTVNKIKTIKLYQDAKIDTST